MDINRDLDEIKKLFPHLNIKDVCIFHPGTPVTFIYKNKKRRFVSEKALKFYRRVEKKGITILASCEIEHEKRKLKSSIRFRKIELRQL